MFGKIRVLRMQPDGMIHEEQLHPEEIEMYLGEDPILSIPIGGGLQLFCSATARIPKRTERVTVLYSAAGRVCAKIYGQTLIGRRDRFGEYMNIQDADVTIARWFVRVTENKEKN